MGPRLFQLLKRIQKTDQLPMYYSGGLRLLQNSLTSGEYSLTSGESSLTSRSHRVRKSLLVFVDRGL